ncbi:hypothetical protein FB451DRAFT_1172140 [Mycena latifolia]|nr:hypothetical protein FB451DRAFT_1172140 [Mycena latifolia]
MQSSSAYGSCSEQFDDSGGKRRVGSNLQSECTEARSTWVPSTKTGTFKSSTQVNELGTGITRSKAGSFGPVWLAGKVGSSFATTIVWSQHTLKSKLRRPINTKLGKD